LDVPRAHGADRQRVQYVNRIKGLLFCHGVSGYKPLRRDRRRRLRDQISRELDRLELLFEQIKAAETERDALLTAQKAATPSTAAMLLDFNGIGPEFTTVPWSEGLFRSLLMPAGADTLAKRIG
jgi:transposase